MYEVHNKSPRSTVDCPRTSHYNTILLLACQPQIRAHPQLRIDGVMLLQTRLWTVDCRLWTILTFAQ